MLLFVFAFFFFLPKEVLKGRAERNVLGYLVQSPKANLALWHFCLLICTKTIVVSVWGKNHLREVNAGKFNISSCRLGRINFISYMALLMRFSRVNPPKVRLKALLNKHFWQMLNRKVKMSDLLQVLGCRVAQFKWNMYLPEGISSTPGVWEDWVVDGHRGRRK